MIRSLLFSMVLWTTWLPAFAQDAAKAAETVQVQVPAPPAPPVAPTPQALPAMRFLSSVLSDELFEALKAAPALSALDKELPGSPLTLLVTHTTRTTAGGQAAGLLSAVLSGSTLGLIPVVSNEQLVVRYEVMLNNKVIATYSYDRTATRAINIWAPGDDANGLGKAGVEWVKSTAKDVAGKLATDPALAALRNEIAFYFPEPAVAAAKPN